MSAKNFLNLSSFKTAARCWVPVTPIRQQAMASRFFSSRQRIVNCNNVGESHIISNDTALNFNGAEEPISNDQEVFHPTVFGSSDVHTVGPVIKHD